MPQILDSELKLLQHVKFWIENSKKCQILSQVFHKQSDFEMKLLKKSRLWEELCSEKTRLMIQFTP